MKTTEPMTKEDKIEIAGRIAIIVGVIMAFGAVIATAFCLYPLFGMLVTGGVLVFTGLMLCSM